MPPFKQGKVHGMGIRDKLVVLDFDDTLYFTFDSAKAAAKELYGFGRLSRRRYDGLSTRQKANICHLGHSKYADRSKLNKELVKRLDKSKTNADIVIITGRDPKLKIPTCRLAKKSGLRVKDVYFARDMARHAMTWRIKTIRKLARGYKSVELFDDRKKHLDYMIKNVTRRKRYKFYLVGRERIVEVR